MGGALSITVDHTREQDVWEFDMTAHWHQGVALAALLGLAAAPAAAQTMGGSSMNGMAGMSAQPGGSSSGSMLGIQPGGEPGSGGVSGGGPATTGNVSGDATGSIHDDLGIKDPFAAAGTGVGGPAPGDKAASNVNDALSNLPMPQLDAAPAGAPGPGLDDRGPPDPLNPLNPLNPLSGSMSPAHGGALMVPPGLNGASSALTPPPSAGQ
jgi:hypothetical protein